MMKMRFLALIALGVAGLAAPAAAQPASQMVCESVNGGPRMCPQPGLTQAFVVQTLGGQCIAGKQWGWSARGITVTNGCRAVFGYRTANYGGGYAPPPPPQYGGQGRPVLCQSMNFQPNRCGMDTRGGVTIGMITNQPCRQGQTWGWDGGGVWVTGNCRAWFRSANNGGGGGGIGSGAGFGGGNGYPGGNPIGSGAGYGGQIITCSSWNFRPGRCQANTRNGVQIVQVLGGECIRNRTWGWDENGIWVNEGCRAQFRIN